LNYGRIQNNVLAQDAKFQALAIAYQQKVLEANAEVEDAIVGFLESQALVQSLAESVAATERSVEIVVTQYRGGVTDFNRVFNLQSALVEQQDQLSAARAEVAVSLIGAYRALGGGWQIRLQGESYRVYDTPAVVPQTPAIPEPGGIRGPSRLIIPEPI
jgi:outer membrane protein TolC